MSGPYTGPGSNPYAGTTTPPPGAGRRADAEPRSSEHMPGGLLALGSSVRVRGHGIDLIGEIRDIASVPTAHLTLTTGLGRHVIFLGPGMTIEPAPAHPALDGHPGLG